MSATSNAVPPLPVDPADSTTKEALSPADPSLVRRAAQANSRPIARRRFFSDVPDKGLFMLFAIGGGVGTFLAKYHGFTGLPTALASVAVLVTYAFAASRLEWFKLHPDRLGDNCYYMGFIFTLASLSAALVGIEMRTGAERDALLESLIGSFGVALFSTIGGITLRVWFMQFRREVEDVEEAIRNDLQGAAQHLKDQLGVAVQNLEAFRTRTQQVMDEQFTAVLEEFTTASKTLAGHLATSGRAHEEAAGRLAVGAERAAAELARAAETIGHQLDAAGAAHREATDQLAASSGRIVKEIRRLVERVDKVDIPSDLLTRQVEAARAQLTDVVASLKHVADQDAERQAATERAAVSLERLLQRMSEMPVFDGIEKSVQRLGAHAEVAAAAMQGVSEKMGTHSETISALTEQAKRDGVAMAEARSRLEFDLKELTEALHKLQGSLASVAEELATRLGG